MVQDTPMHHPIRLAVIGAGKMAESFHLPAIKRYQYENPGSLELVGVSDPVPERGRPLTEKFGCGKWYSETTEMLNAVKPDAAYVLVPYRTVGIVSSQVLGKGIHTFMEKPPGMTALETEHLASLAREKGLITIVGFNRRHQSAVKTARSWLENNGEPLQFIRGCKHRSGRIHEEYAMYTSIHSLDLILWFGGDITHMRQWREPIPNTSAYNFVVTFRFVSGALGMLTALPNVAYNQEVLELHTSAETAVIDTQFGHKELDHLYFRVFKGERLTEEKTFSLAEDRIVTEGFYGLTKSFLDALRGGPAPYPSVEDCVMTMRLAEAMQKGMGWESVAPTVERAK